MPLAELARPSDTSVRDAVGTRRLVLGLALPVLALGAARWAATSELALRHPRIAAALFTWIAADALMLGLLLHAPERTPRLTAIIASLASSAALVLLAPTPAVHTGLVQLAWLERTLIAVIALEVALLCAQGAKVWRQTQGSPPDRIRSVAQALLPTPLYRLARAELSLLQIALFRWNARPDVPAGTQPFTNHRHLGPMLLALLVLQVIEAAATDLVVRIWFPTLAQALVFLGEYGVLFTVGLVKSLRLRPVLLCEDGVRIRLGLLRECFVRYEDILEPAQTLDPHEVRAPTTRRMAILVWPNVMLRLRPGHAGRAPRGRSDIQAIALHLDEPEAFIAALRARIDPSV
ncbi:hypothetical protein MTR62_04785 [Novosphingobium sp. 1949]|uniref:Uncharacterized protein n=1 Tax=Novosphingobium organovorum TaxID=2930092 RepID=A0ABT0BAB4_9SPHN|nr:hypothetical protein [Novosphingobium organovorum]MCJ2182020.1 hypothetical protein [Novosphingobium organovorum]